MNIIKLALFVVVALVSTTASAQNYRVQNGQIYRGTERIHLLGVNWFGFESDLRVAHGLWARRYVDMIASMKQLGFNAVRLPFGREAVDNLPVTSGFNTSANPEFVGLGSLDIMDLIVAEFARQEMHVLLDFHTIRGQDHTFDLWYDPSTPGSTEEDWIDALCIIAKRYKDSPYVMGIDLKNEPHGAATWGVGNPASDWKRAAEAAAEAVITENDRVLVFIEGIETNPDCSDNSNNIWWGGNLQPMECYPPNVAADRLVLSPHVYGPDVFEQPYFSASNFPENLPTIWDTHFGFAKSLGYVVAPGEFGGKYGNGGLDSDITWQNRIIDYFIDKKIFDFFYWSWNPNSGDTNGIVLDDWETVETAKYNNLRRLIDAANADLGNPIPNIPPAVSIINPTVGSNISGPTTVTIEASASDADGSVASVSFLLDGVVIGTDTTAPYSFTTSELAFGSYEISAHAIDDENAETTSTPISIIISDPDNPIAMGDLCVQYRDGSNNITQSSELRPVLRIVNKGDTTVPLNELTIRYWFTTDVNTSNVYNCDFAQVGAANVTGTFVTLDTPTQNADTYLELGFTEAAGSLAANSDSGEIQTRNHKQNYSPVFDQSNDYSFDATLTSFTDTTRITLYRSGVLISGMEPINSTVDPDDTDNDGLPDTYEAASGLTIGIDDADLDLDGDGMTNIEEYIAGTQPNNSNSLLQITNLIPSIASQTQISWSSESNRIYTLQSTSDPSTVPFSNVRENIVPTPPLNTTTIASSGDKRFFRIQVTPASN